MGTFNPRNIQRLLADVERKKQEYKALTSPGAAEGQLGNLTQMLQSQIRESPYETAGYQSQVGSLTDLIRQTSQADAGRAAASGMTPGMAIAAGAGARSQALSSGIRSAAAGAERRQQQQTGQLASLLGTQAGLERNRQGMLLSLLERQKDRKSRERGSFLNSLTSLAGGAIGFALGGPPGAMAGYGMASVPRPDSALNDDWTLRL